MLSSSSYQLQRSCKFKATFGRNTPSRTAGLLHYPGGFMRLLSQMHSSFRGVSGSLSVRSSFSFYLLAPPVPLHLFLSLVRFSPGFCRTPGPSTLHNVHEHRRSAHSPSHPSPSSFSSLPPLSSTPATRQWFLFVFGIHVLLSASSIFIFYFYIII
jgi:hypothetical protein